MKQISVTFFLITIINSAKLCANPPNTDLLLVRAEKMLTEVIVHDIFSPPVASRIYLYANIAAYEATVPSQKMYRSLSYSVSSFPQVILPSEGEIINFQLASVYAYMKTASRFVFTEKILMDSLNVLLQKFKHTKKTIYNNTVKYAKQVADSIIKWADKDNYGNTRKLKRYTFNKTPGKWTPTPPGYMNAVEPYWGKMRTVALDSASQFKPDSPLEYSEQSNTAFYKQAYETYSVVKELTKEQKEIALFWDCNPFFLNVQGHLNFATKKLSPGGHWISIVGIACKKKNCDLMQTTAAYLLTSIALYDGFISCWDEKYRSNLVRPETFINMHIDEKWKPLLQTPPFPEYTSGHSVISTAAATVLTELFGEDFTFEDNTEVPYGLPVRSFGSFSKAADEAAISRLYGGIHYRAAIENGQVQGALIGKKVLQKIKLSK